MLQKLTAETGKDLELQKLLKVVMRGWPRTKEETPVQSRPYWNYRNEISCYAGLMFEWIRIIIAHSLRPETLQRMHAAQLGVEKCRVRARTAVFWPGINAAIDDLVSSSMQYLSAASATQPEIALESRPSPPGTLVYSRSGHFLL